MEKLVIRSGSIRLEIVDEEGTSKGVFQFNPNDIRLAERVAEAQEDFVVKQKEFQEKVDSITNDKDLIKEANKICDYFCDMIDEIFGDGTCELLFGKELSLDGLFDFFDGISPYFQEASKNRTSKYSKKKTTK